MKNRFGLIAFLLLVLVCGRPAGGQQPAPLTQKEVIDLVKSGAERDRVLATIAERRVDFDLNPEIEKKLRKAKADDQVVEAVKKSGPTARAGQQAQPGGQAAFQQQPEAIDLQAIRDELDPDRQLQMVDEFEKKYPGSSVLTYAYLFAAFACNEKNDIKRAVEYGEKSLKLKEDNLQSLLLVASVLPQPQMLQGSDLDKEKKLADSEAYANRALQLIEQLPRQPGDTDEQFQKRKGTLSSAMHASLGMVHLQRSMMALAGLDKDELTKAEQEYKTAASLTDQPNFETYFRLGEVYAIQQRLDEAVEAFTRASQLGEGTPLKATADQRLEEMKKRKSPATPPAKP